MRPSRRFRGTRARPTFRDRKSRARGLVASSLFTSSDESDGSVLVAWVISCLDLKHEAPLLGSLEMVHASSQISYLLIHCHHPSARKDAFQRHQERAEPTHDGETVDCRSRSNKKHQRGKGKQHDGQCKDNLTRQCRDQDWKQEKGERGNAETLQKLTQVFDMLSHYTSPRLKATGHSSSWTDDMGQCPVKGTRAAFFKFTHGKRL